MNSLYFSPFIQHDRMKIALIAAVAANQVIGRSNDLPWHLPDDFKFFKEKTKGHPIIMGRKSLESLGKPLPKRTNIVITRDLSRIPAAYKDQGVVIVDSLEMAINEAQQVEESEIFIIGGAEIYTLALPLATTLYLTEIQENYEGDTYFPQFDKNEWQEVARRHHPVDERHGAAFDFVTYERKVSKIKIS